MIILGLIPGRSSRVPVLQKSMNPPTSCASDVIFPGKKRPERDVGHLPLSSVEGKNGWSCASPPLYAFIAWTVTTGSENVIIKHKEETVLQGMID